MSLSPLFMRASMPYYPWWRALLRSDVIVKPDYFTHWKTQMLVSVTGLEESKLWPLMLWAHCERKKNEKHPNLPRYAVRSICGTTLPEDEVINALEASGYAYYDGADFIVHEWEKYNSSLIAAWENGKKGGRPITEKPTAKKPTGSRGDTDGIPSENPRRTDKSREDKTRKEYTVVEKVSSVEKLDQLPEQKW